MAKNMKVYALYDPDRNRIVSHHDSIDDLVSTANRELAALNKGGALYNKNTIDRYATYIIQEHDLVTSSYTNICTFANYERVTKIRKMLGD